MNEFKFSCPTCGQHIQVTDAYSGRQINCPACEVLILVPQPPGLPPIIPHAATSPTRQPAVSAGKSSTVKWVVIGSVASLVVVGAIAFALVSGVFSHPDQSPAGIPDQKASAQRDSKGTASANPQSLSAAEIVQKVAEQYASLASYSATGAAVSDMDMSKVDPKNMPGMDKLPAGATHSNDLQQAMSKWVRTESEFSVKLGRSGFYRVEWEGKAGPAAMKGAVWSAGEGHLLSMANTKYTKMASREMALASATGISGGVAGTMPAIFFQDRTSALTFFKKAKQSEDQAVEGEDCYVLHGDAAGTKVILWVAKSNFLIKQKQTVVGGASTMPEMSEADMDKALKKMGNLTPQQAAQAKAAMKSMKPMLSQMKGTITETYRSIEVNQPVKKEDFSHELPAGATLSKSLF